MSWIGQEEVDIYPPAAPTKGFQRSRKSLDEHDSPVPLRVNIILVKPSAHFDVSCYRFSFYLYQSCRTLGLLMNVSGKSVALAYRAHIRPLGASHVIVLHDSLSHKPLSLHPRLGGSSNGHNGVASVISAIQGPNFHRIRIGIGRPENNGRYEGYVLGKLEPKEREWWGQCGEGVDKAWAAVEDIVRKELEGSK